jgi:broad specificity phosphatase PhoE
MSDLHCPATLVLARHAEADFVERSFSDEGGSLTTAGRAQARELAESLSGRRVAAVWCSDSSRAVQTAEIAAARLGVAVAARKSLREVYVGTLMGQPFDAAHLNRVCDSWYDGSLDTGFEGGESGHDVVARYAAQLGEIADLHRGETVLVVGHQQALGIAVPSLARNLTPAWARAHDLENTETVEVEQDADGWVLRRWGRTEMDPTS